MHTWTRGVVVAAALGLSLAGSATPQIDDVAIHADTAVTLGPMTPMWAWFGYDEPNYTYTPNGKKLLSELAALSPVPVFVRTHNLLTTGDGTRGAEVGIDERLHRRRERPAGLRLDDRRSHHRHVSSNAR